MRSSLQDQHEAGIIDNTIARVQVHAFDLLQSG